MNAPLRKNTGTVVSKTLDRLGRQSVKVATSIGALRTND